MIPQNEPDYGQREIDAVMDYLRSGGWLTEYKQTREFERLYAKRLGVEYAITVTSGTAALAMAVMALDISGEVIVPDYSIIATATAVELAGATVKLADVELSTHCLDPGFLESVITTDTEAVMIVPNNGRSPNDAVFEIARDCGLKIIEDSCQCFGSKHGDRSFGTLGDVGCYSLSHHKIVTTGQGGVVVTDDPGVYEKVCRLRNFGRSMTSGLQEYSRPGYNFKFNDILASFGIVQLETVDERLEKKREIYERYRKNLDDIAEFSAIGDGNILSVVDILVDDPRGLQKYLSSKEIETRLFYPPIHTYYNGATDEDYPNSCRLFERGLWLPSSSKLTLEEVDLVCREIKNYYQQR